MKALDHENSWSFLFLEKFVHILRGYKRGEEENALIKTIFFG